MKGVLPVDRGSYRFGGDQLAKARPIASAGDEQQWVKWVRWAKWGRLRPSSAAFGQSHARSPVFVNSRGGEKNPPNPPNPLPALTFECLRQWGCQWVKGVPAPIFQRWMSLMTAMPDERPVYGCAGADCPEATPSVAADFT